MAVLSFFGNIQLKAILLIFTSKKQKVNTMSLQVLCSPLFNTLWSKSPGKRVLPLISPNGLLASMTVEAAIVLPLFVFLAISLLMPVKMLDTQRKIQTIVEGYCEKLSLYSYLGEETSEYKTLASNAITGVWLQGKLGAGDAQVYVRHVAVPDEDGNIVLETVYAEPVPFFFGRIPGISVEASSKRRRWTGYSGKLVTNKDENTEEESEAEEMVYVGKKMGRYHRDRNCHYISNQYQAVSVDEAKGMRDADGHKLKACTACCGAGILNDTVYVTSGGRHYHSRMDCGAMVSYVRRVPLAEAAYLGACSYCGGQS